MELIEIPTIWGILENKVQLGAAIPTLGMTRHFTGVAIHILANTYAVGIYHGKRVDVVDDLDPSVLGQFVNWHLTDGLELQRAGGERNKDGLIAGLHGVCVGGALLSHLERMDPFSSTV